MLRKHDDGAGKRIQTHRKHSAVMPSGGIRREALSHCGTGFSASWKSPFRKKKNDMRTRSFRPTVWRSAHCGKAEKHAV